MQLHLVTKSKMWLKFSLSVSGVSFTLGGGKISERCIFFCERKVSRRSLNPTVLRNTIVQQVRGSVCGSLNSSKKGGGEEMTSEAFVDVRNVHISPFFFCDKFFVRFCAECFSFFECFKIRTKSQKKVYCIVKKRWLKTDR